MKILLSVTNKFLQSVIMWLQNSSREVALHYSVIVFLPFLVGLYRFKYTVYIYSLMVPLGDHVRSINSLIRQAARVSLEVAVFSWWNEWDVETVGLSLELVIVVFSILFFYLFIFFKKAQIKGSYHCYKPESPQGDPYGTNFKGSSGHFFCNLICALIAKLRLKCFVYFYIFWSKILSLDLQKV